MERKFDIYNVHTSRTSPKAVSVPHSTHVSWYHSLQVSQHTILLLSRSLHLQAMHCLILPSCPFSSRIASSISGNGFISFFSKHEVKWLLICSTSNNKTSGACPEEMVIAKAMANRPQSLLLGCTCISSYHKLLTLATFGWVLSFQQVAACFIELLFLIQGPYRFFCLLGLCCFCHLHNAAVDSDST